MADGIDETIEPSYQRGEWATQAELTWRSGRVTRRLVTYAVVHVPANAVLTRYLSRAEARQLVSWLARDGVRLDADGQGPAETLRRLSTIVRVVQHYRCRGESVTALSRSDWAARVDEDRREEVCS